MLSQDWPKVSTKKGIDFFLLLVYCNQVFDLNKKYVWILDLEDSQTLIEYFCLDSVLE